MDKLGYTVPEAADAISISRSELYLRLASGEIESIKIGRRRIIPVSALQEWVDRLRAEQAANKAVA